MKASGFSSFLVISVSNSPNERPMKCHTVISILSDIAKPKPLGKQRAFYYFIFVAYRDRRRAEKSSYAFHIYIYEDITPIKESKLKKKSLQIKGLVISD